MSETCRCGDELWWKADGKVSGTSVLCETCGGWEVLDKHGYCNCGKCGTDEPIEPIKITVEKVIK